MNDRKQHTYRERERKKYGKECGWGRWTVRFLIRMPIAAINKDDKNEKDVALAGRFGYFCCWFTVGLNANKAENQW